MPSDLKITPLGGLGRIGGNFTLYETAEHLIVVDCGIGFPRELEPGVDYLIPRFDYLLQQQHKLRAVVLTHGHEDHLGALPHLFEHFNPPIYATPFALSLVKRKFERRPQPKIVTLQPAHSVTIGDFTILPVTVAHSIPEALSLHITTAHGTVLHTGDFNCDDSGFNDWRTDRKTFSRLGEAGIDVLLSDSTNSCSRGTPCGEKAVKEALKKAVAGAKQRVIITTFSSNIQRMQSILIAAREANRGVMLVGRSVQQYMDSATELSLLDTVGIRFIGMEQYGAVERDKLLIIASGSQGEPRSAFTRIANGGHRNIQLSPGDLAICSSKQIPGNETAIQTVHDNLRRLGVDIIDEHHPHIHTSGHAYPHEQTEMLTLCKPRYFVPVHGENFHLLAHAKTGEKAGVNKDNIVIIENGIQLSLAKENNNSTILIEGEPVPHGISYLQGGHVVSPIVLQDRIHLRDYGIITCTVVVSLKGKGKVRVIGDPVLHTRGVFHIDSQTKLLQGALSAVIAAAQKITTSEGKVTQRGGGAKQDRHGKQGHVDDPLEECVRLALRRYFRKELGQKPVLLVGVVRL